MQRAVNYTKIYDSNPGPVRDVYYNNEHAHDEELFANFHVRSVEPATGTPRQSDAESKYKISTCRFIGYLPFP